MTNSIIFVFYTCYGFADNLKGMMTCYKLSLIKSTNFKININKLPKYNFDKYVNNELLDNKNFKSHQFFNNSSINNFKNFIKNEFDNLIKKQDIYIETNIDISNLYYNINNRKLKYNLEVYNIVKNDFKNISNIIYFDKITELISINFEYITIHVRLGDKMLNSNLDNYDNQELINYINNIILENQSNTKFVILSDNKNIIKYIQKNILYHEFLSFNNNQSEHFNKIKTIDQLNIILIDFYILLKSKKIYSYNWSGFSFYASLISNIEYIQFNV